MLSPLIFRGQKCRSGMLSVLLNRGIDSFPSKEGGPEVATGCAQGLFQGGPWLRWLELAAGAEDCKLSSHARRALLNLRSAQALAAAQVLGGPLSALAALRLCSRAGCCTFVWYMCPHIGWKASLGR